MSHVDVARLLLEQHGADANARDNSRDRPLHLVSGSGRLDIARLLVEHGAKVDAEDGTGMGWTSFRVASERGQHDVAKVSVGPWL